MQTQAATTQQTYQRRGATHPKAKLTTAQVDEIREIYESGGVGYPYLAKIYGCGISTIRDIALYRTRCEG